MSTLSRIKVLLCTTKEDALTADAMLIKFHTVEAEYGDFVLESRGELTETLAHHGSRVNNPAPCVFIAECSDITADIIVSHIDLDTIGGVLSLTASDISYEEYPEFWEAVAFIDVNGPHHLHEIDPFERLRMNAWWAYQTVQKKERPEGIVDVTSAIIEAEEVLGRILGGDEKLLNNGDKWAKELQVTIESKLIEETDSIRVFVTDGLFCAASYYSPKLKSLAKATVSLNTKLNTIIVAFEDGGKERSAEDLVQWLWGGTAGGRAGIAGSPRGQVMSESDLRYAVESLKVLYK